MSLPDQYTGWRLRTAAPAQVMRGSHSGWYLVNRVLPLSTWLPPANTMRDQLKATPLMVELLAGNALPLASIDVPALMLPALMTVARSVRRALASTTAPSTLSKPAPCCSRLALASGWAEYCKMALTSGGVSPGLACSINATVPATAGAAIEVPLSIIWVSLKTLVMPSGVTSVL